MQVFFLVELFLQLKAAFDAGLCVFILISCPFGGFPKACSQAVSLQEPSGTASFKQKSGEKNTRIYLYTLYKQYVLFVSGDAF